MTVAGRLGSALHRLGLGIRYTGPSFWVHLEDIEALDDGVPLLERLLAGHGRYRLVVTVPGAALRRIVRQRLPDALVTGPPPGLDLVLRRFFGVLSPHVLLVLGRAERLSTAAFRRARRYPFPILVVEGRRPLDLAAPDGERIRPLADRFLVRRPDTARALAKRGVAAEQIVRLPDAADETRADAFVSAVTTTPRRDLNALGKVSLSLPVRAARALMRTPPGRRLVARRAERIADLPALRQALGQPDTILCLGNGPSSIDPRLRDIRYDNLFRVNHRWLDGGFLTEADMVFTGDAGSVAALPGGIVGFRTVEEETQILLRLALSRRARRFRYATIGRLPVSINEVRWEARPTNGAAMIALAAALQPRRLVIAGIDLFEHPAGSYAGDATVANMYFVVHDRDVEVAVIRHALAGFRGEVEILSDALARRLVERASA